MHKQSYLKFDKSTFNELLKRKIFYYVEKICPENVFLDVADFLIISDYPNANSKSKNHKTRYVKVMITDKGIYGGWVLYYKIKLLSEVTTKPMSFDD